MSARKTVSVHEEWCAVRSYLWRPPKGRAKRVLVQVGLPERSGRDWACRVRITGLPAVHDRPVFGVDSIQALELALQYSGIVLSSSPEFRAGQIEQYGRKLNRATALSLPLPLARLQSQLESVQDLLDRMRLRRKFDRIWQWSLLGIMYPEVEPLSPS